MEPIERIPAPETGIHPGVPFSEYQKWDAVNNSLLQKIATNTPAHGRSYLLAPPEPSKDMDIGSALHCRVMEPTEFPRRYVIAPKVDRRTKKGKETWEVFQSSLNGKTILTDADYEMVDGMGKAIENHPSQIIEWVRGGEREVCIVWVDEKTGLLCKARLDIVFAYGQNTAILDIKSTRDAAPHWFRRSIYNYGYHQQMAFYRDGWHRLTENWPLIVAVAAEKKELILDDGPMWPIAIYQIDSKSLQLGRQDYEKALMQYADCQKSGKWPAYSDRIELLELDDWMLRRGGIGPHEILEDE